MTVELIERLRSYGDEFQRAMTDEPSLRALVAPTHPRRRRRPALVAVAVAVGVVILVAVVVAAALRDANESAPLRPADTPTVSPAIDLQSALLPATLQDAKAASALGGVIVQENYRVQQQCLAGHGYPDVLVKPASDTNDRNVRYFEDPAYLRAQGFGVAANLKPGPASPVTQTPQPPTDVLTTCADPAIMNKVAVETSRLTSAWMQLVAQIDTSPAMDQVWTDWRACMSGKGYDLANEDAVYSLADASIAQAAHNGVDIRSVEMPIATAYADCLESAHVVEARGAARAEARAGFIAAHDAQYEQVVGELPSLIASVQSR